MQIIPSVPVKAYNLIEESTMQPAGFYLVEPPVEEFRSYRQPDGFEAVYLVSTTHRFGLCRESQPRTDEYFFDQVQQFYLVGSNNKFAWLSSRCRETDNDIYSISTVSLTQITEVTFTCAFMTHLMRFHYALFPYRLLER